MYPDNSIHKTSDGLELHMDVNRLGNFLFTLLLLDLVNAAPKYEIVSQLGRMTFSYDVNFHSAEAESCS